MCAALSARTLNLADLVIAEHRTSICGLAGERRLARTIHDPRCTWLATVGCLDPAVLFFAALVALKNRWFWCGCLLALGAMFKGQLYSWCRFLSFGRYGKNDG